LHGDEALEFARRWIRLSSEDELSYRAMEVIGRHGDAADIPAVRRVAQHWSERDEMYATSTGVEALSALGDVEAIPWFRELFASTQYSYLRRQCARGLAALDSNFSASFATECLWDCESGTRLIGCQAAPAGPEVSARINRLADDELEDEAVRIAAKAREAQPD
jgi:hypothetical protein